MNDYADVLFPFAFDDEDEGDDDMKGYIKLEHIEYKKYEKGIVCKKASVFSRFPRSILIYTEQGDSVLVHCRIITDFKMPGRVLKEIMELPIGGIKRQYAYMCILTLKDIECSIYEVGAILSVLNASAGKTKECGYFYEADRKSSTRDLPHMIIGVPFNMTKEICDTFSAGLITHDFKRSFLGGCSTTNNDVKAQIQFWITNTSFKEFRNAIEESVLGQSNLPLVLVNVYQYLHGIASGSLISRNNSILTGPSGSGKTETFRALKTYFKKHIPNLVVSIRDMNQLTSEGYKGQDTSYIVEEIKRANTNGIGIVFLDEFDKRLLPDFCNGENINAGIQAQILTAIEGCMLNGVDTAKTLFIGLGSFDSVRSVRTKEMKFGFGVERRDENDFFYKITREEMIEMGALYELIGRFPSIINYEALSSEAIDRIIDMRLAEISKEVGITIIVSKEMRKDLHANSNTPYGNRLIDSMIRETVNKALVEILTDDLTVAKLLITGQDKYEIERREPDFVDYF